MTNPDSIGATIWGPGVDSAVVDSVELLALRKTVDPVSARRVLDAVVEVELRKAIDRIQAGIDQNRQETSYLADSPNSLFYEGVHFFGRPSYHVLVRAIEICNPGYEFTNSPLGGMAFKRKG